MQTMMALDGRLYDVSELHAFTEYIGLKTSLFLLTGELFNLFIIVHIIK